MIAAPRLLTGDEAVASLRQTVISPLVGRVFPSTVDGIYRAGLAAVNANSPHPVDIIIRGPHAYVIAWPGDRVPVLTLARLALDPRD